MAAVPLPSLSDATPGAGKLVSANVKLAFSTAAFAGWELPRIIEVGKSLGFEGIELAGEGLGAAGGLAALGNSAIALRQMVEEGGLRICAIASSHVLHEPSKVAWEKRRAAIVQTVAIAEELGAKGVRIFGATVARGEGRDVAITRVGARLREVALAAQERGVDIVLQNADSFVTPRELWTILEVGRSRDIGASSPGSICWDVAEAAISEPTVSPTNAVSMLNARIKLAHVWDHSGTRAPLPLGTGVVKNKLFVERLRGVGFGATASAGWLVYAPPVAPAADQMQAFLEAAAEAMKSWTRKPAALQPAPGATKNAAKPTPVPTAKPS